MYEKKQLFDFMIDRVREVGKQFGLRDPQAFPRWFATMYFQNPMDVRTTDSSGDGKVDLFFKVNDRDRIENHILNAKFTSRYNEIAPVSFYDEITRFWQAFANKPSRNKYLKSVRQELRAEYKALLNAYDESRASLVFVTNHRRNERQHAAVESYGVQVFHLEDIVQFMADHMEDAMPRTPEMLLTGIGSVLSPDRQDTNVPTSIVFARLMDFIAYMEHDRYSLLFARNVRLSLGDTPVNAEIRETFEEAPGEFAFSNNGITMLCERHRHDPGTKELRIENPRVVNGSQTLHSVLDSHSPARNARVMLRIIEIPAPSPNDLPAQIQNRKEIIQKISVRSNRQNPIKRWNLVANDDFQQDLARFFRKKSLFYERRQREWIVRKADLRSVGVKRGPAIKGLAQLISSYYFSKKNLGPAVAKSSVGELFEDKAYETISKTLPELAYELYLIDEIVSQSFRALAERKRYIRNLIGHADLSFFSRCIMVLDSCGAKWGKSQFGELLESQLNASSKAWRRLSEMLLRQIDDQYGKESRTYWRKESRQLTRNNFFKSQGYVGRLLALKPPSAARKFGRAILA
ncbi:MAG TPA: AIPR family protein [Candidatus Acidoferrales bacterium]|nr:AIPR family protein [Candidatus Acidoferrales bacterium]